MGNNSWFVNKTYFLDSQTVGPNHSFNEHNYTFFIVRAQAGLQHTPAQRVFGWHTVWQSPDK